MNVVQLLLESATDYERKSQRIDRTSFPDEHVISTWLGERDNLRSETGLLVHRRRWPETIQQAGADLVHVYAGASFDGTVVRGLSIPYVAAGRPLPKRFFQRPEPHPQASTSPLAEDRLPEAVDISYFAASNSPPGAGGRVGVYAGRPDITRFSELTRVRIERFRDDVQWALLQRPPSPDELRGFDVWVDPTTDDCDFDGQVAQASASGVIVVAARTPINLVRLEGGAAGFLAPAGDPNELAHAILNALFKPELSTPRLRRAREIQGRYDPARRVERLLEIYRRILSR